MGDEGRRSGGEVDVERESKEVSGIGDKRGK